MSLYLSQGNAWYPPQTISINVDGQWISVRKLFANDGNTWSEVWPETEIYRGDQYVDTRGNIMVIFFKSGIYTTPTQYSTSANPILTVSGGGGGGACNQDGCTSGGGGAGATVTTSYIYTPALFTAAAGGNQILPAGQYTVIVGAGGAGDAPSTNSGLGGPIIFGPVDTWGNYPPTQTAAPPYYAIVAPGGGNGGEGGGDWDGAAYHNPDGSKGASGGGGGGQGQSDHNHRNGLGGPLTVNPYSTFYGARGQDANFTGGAGGNDFTQGYVTQGVPALLPNAKPTYWPSNQGLQQRFTMGGYGYQQGFPEYGPNTGFGGCGCSYRDAPSYLRNGCSGMVVFYTPIKAPT